MKIGIVVGLAFVLLVTGCVPITDSQGNVVEIQKAPNGQVFFQETTKGIQMNETIHALVKGSIYETGEMMSVFGTCMNANDTPLQFSYANLSAWYPNGTPFIYESPMSQIQDGYFVWQGPMVSVQGTYLTRMTCHLDNTIFGNLTASAFGEWQNPYWVRRIALLNDSVSNITSAMSSLASTVNISLANLSSTVNNSFAITWDKINYTNYVINYSVNQMNQSIYYVASVANASVDRQDSYLASLLQNITSVLVNGVNATGQALDHTEAADEVVYWRIWNIYVKANVPGNPSQTITYPSSQCYINTTLSPTVTPMTWVPTTGSGSSANVKDYFTYSERITSGADFVWTVNCFRT